MEGLENQKKESRVESDAQRNKEFEDLKYLATKELGDIVTSAADECVEDFVYGHIPTREALIEAILTETRRRLEEGSGSGVLRRIDDLKSDNERMRESEGKRDAA